MTTNIEADLNSIRLMLELNDLRLAATDSSLGVTDENISLIRDQIDILRKRVDDLEKRVDLAQAVTDMHSDRILKLTNLFCLLSRTQYSNSARIEEDPK